MRVLVVDAFATEPMGGRPVAVLPEAELTDDQYRRVRAELGVVGALAAEPEGLRSLDPRGDVAVAVAAGALVGEGYDPGERTVRGRGREHRDLHADVAADGTVTVDLPAATEQEVDVGEADVADALGVDPAALSDVGADLPMARVAAGAGYLAVPVNFLERLGEANPDREWLAGLLDTVDVEALYAFTFDTLSTAVDLHARVFTREREVAVSGRAVAAVAPYLVGEAFDPDRKRLVATSGRYVDRPSRVTVSLGDDGPQVRGRSVVAFDGTAAVPEAENGDDDILGA